MAVLLERKVHNLYLSLKKGDDFKRVIDRGLDILKGEMFAEDRIKKEQIPRYYVSRYGVNNLYRLRLNGTRRLCYTIIADEEGVKVVVLEVFPNHKSYDRRFGYKTS